jgi:hypothetical protein
VSRLSEWRSGVKGDEKKEGQRLLLIEVIRWKQQVWMERTTVEAKKLLLARWNMP